MIKNLCQRTKGLIYKLKSDLVNNLAVLIPVAISLIVLINGIISYIMFIVNGGYTTQIELTKELGIFEGYDEKFTKGTTEMIYAGIVGKTLVVLFVGQFILLMINYFSNSGIAKKILMIVNLLLIVGFIIYFKGTLSTYALLSLIPILGVIVLVLITDDCRWILGYTAISAGFSYIVVPLVFLFLENIIPLVTGIVALIITIILTVVVFSVFMFMICGEDEVPGFYHIDESGNKTRISWKDL